MSSAPVDPSHASVPIDWAGALVSVAAGLAAMLARLLTLERATWGFLLRSMFTAAVCSYFVGEGTRTLFGPNQQGLWLCTVGLAGFASPEVVTWLIGETPKALRWASRKVKGWLGGNPKRPKAKAKRSRRKPRR